jgi:trafficking protein particle complex subunit 10
MNAVNSPGKYREFGGLDAGDDQAALLNPGFKALTEIVQDDVFREFEFRQYIFACQAKVCTLYIKDFSHSAHGPVHPCVWLHIMRVCVSSMLIFSAVLLH